MYIHFQELTLLGLVGDIHVIIYAVKALLKVERLNIQDDPLTLGCPDGGSAPLPLAIMVFIE